MESNCCLLLSRWLLGGDLLLAGGEQLGAVGSSLCGDASEVGLGQLDVLFLGLGQNSGHGTLLSGQGSTTLENLSIGVQLNQLTHIGQRIETTNATEDALAWVTQHLADFLRFKEARQVCVGHLRLGQIVALLQGGGFLPGAEKIIQTRECRLGPDDKATDMATRSQFQQVQLVHTDGLNAGDVAECLTQTLILVVHDQRTTTGNAATIAHGTTASTETLRLVHLLIKVRINISSFKLDKIVYSLHTA